MNQKKASVSFSMQQIAIFIFFIIAFLFSTTIFSNTYANTKSNSINFLNEQFDFRINEAKTDNDDLTVRVPEKLEDYAKGLAFELFDQTITREGDGSMVFITPFIDGLENPKKYEDFSIRMYWVDYVAQKKGIAMVVHNSETKENLEIASPVNDEYVRDIKLCALPKLENSPDIRSAFMNYEGFGSLLSVLEASDIVSEGYVEQIVLSFGKENTPYRDGVADFNAMHIVSQNGAFVIFKYEEDGSNNDLKFPLYVYGNTICFMGTSYGDAEGVRYLRSSDPFHRNVRGYGPIHWSLVELMNKGKITG